MKVLILKLGFSETLDPEIGATASFGDVLRTTPVLAAVHERYPGAKVTWVTDAASVPLLRGIPLLDRVLAWDPFVPFQLTYEHFDVLINLEKVAGLCALADNIRAWQKFGFRFLPHEGTFRVYAGGEEAYRLVVDPAQKRDNPKSWQQVLIEMIGCAWKEQPYFIGHTPAAPPTVDVGFNVHVGAKWPTKAWPLDLWKALERLLKGFGLSVSWQQGKENLLDYIDWVGSSRILVTNDSLGLHVALALRRRLVALFGPTKEAEVHLYGLGEAVTPPPLPCRPCLLPRCERSAPCIGAIDPERVADAVRRQIALAGR